MTKRIAVTLCWMALVLWGLDILVLLCPYILPFRIKEFYWLNGWIVFIIFAVADVVNFIFKYVRRWLLVLKFIVHVLMYLIYCLTSLSLHA
jgi:hypothetical protein